MASGSTVKWFDLSTLDAKLERREASMGHFKLMLDVPSKRLEHLKPDLPSRSISEELEDMGWVVRASGQDRFLLTNYAPMNRKTEIVRALRPFFSEEEIEANHVPVHALTQGEKVEGLQTRHLISEHELAKDIAGVADSDFDRIMRSVKKAQSLLAEREKKQQAVLFDGRGTDVLFHLTDAVMERKGWDEPEAAMLALRTIETAIMRPSQGMSGMLTELGSAISRADETSINTLTANVVGAMVPSNISWEAQRSDLLNSARLRHISKKIEAMPASTEGRVSSFRQAALMVGAGIAPRLTPAVMSRVDVAVPMHEAIDYFREKLPFSIVRDSSVPTVLLAQNMAAVDKALDVVASELELPRDKLLPLQTTVPVRFSYDAVLSSQGALGFVQRVKTDRSAVAEGAEFREAMTMNLSVTEGKTFIHELGHLIDDGNGITEEERHAILQRSGALAAATVAVDRLYPDGGAGRADYLLDEHEIFARTFNAHFVNLALARGDQTLSTLGGMQTVLSFDEAAAFGDLEMTSSFISELKDTLAVRREAQLEAGRKAEAEQMASPGASVSFASHSI